MHLYIIQAKKTSLPDFLSYFVDYKDKRAHSKPMLDGLVGPGEITKYEKGGHFPNMPVVPGASKKNILAYSRVYRQATGQTSRQPPGRPENHQANRRSPGKPPGKPPGKLPGKPLGHRA